MNDEIEEEKAETWTVTVEFTVFGGDMGSENVMSEAERLLIDLTDGTDFCGLNVIDAKRDEL